MHIILEGSLELCMRLLLIYLIFEEKAFSLDILNNRIHQFNYGHSDKQNKPSKLQRKHLATDSYLKQSASQMWCLARYLPFLIGTLVCEDNDHWENFLTLLSIMDYVFAPLLTSAKADYIAAATEDFLSDFVDLYPHRRLIPKMHYMIHLSTWIKRAGPLCNIWCMRYEAKHSYFKRISQVCRNFKNVAKTLADHHQQYMCYHMSDHMYLRAKLEYNKDQDSTVGSLEYKEKLLAASFEVSINTNTVVYRNTKITIDGVRYHKDMAVILEFDNNLPSFGKIMEIIVTCEEVLFVTSALHTVMYHHHFHGYEVLGTSEITVRRQQTLSTYHPLAVSKPYGMQRKTMICLKYHVFDN
ncbi:uncharacterized protein [Dysidea avara]|uniref:uncharacterized protein n=1 Tax=Dysidea avara TaxID=196820 RepID=UPI003319872F